MAITDILAKGVGELTGGSQNSFIGKFLANETQGKDLLAPDFENLTITEFQEGSAVPETEIILQSTFMPLIPFEFGGQQNLVKERYPGNPEPTVQVMGAEEDDVTIHGAMKANRFKSLDLKRVCLEFQKAMDEMRKRGNIVRIQLGEWRRYGFISKSKFKLNRITDIEYELTFFIVGENYPSSNKQAGPQEEEPATANLELISKANTAMESMKTYPDSMPRSISDNLKDMISGVAGVISSVNSAINSLVTEAENIKAAGARAEGVIKNARRNISTYQRRLAVFGTTMPSLREKYGVAQGISEEVKNKQALATARSNILGIQSYLASLQAIVARYAVTIPLRTHQVKDGDTLQKISMLYYKSQDQWQKIMQHNNLQSTDLTGIRTLEIPK